MGAPYPADLVHAKHPHQPFLADPGQKEGALTQTSEEVVIGRKNRSRGGPYCRRFTRDHKIYRYFLRGFAITEPNHVLACDITRIPMANGFLYLAAIVEGASRAVLSWRQSNTIDPRFCAEAREEALQRHGEPRISAQCDPLRDNADQGAQFASAVFTGKLEAASIAISADERGRFLDIISIERLRRSIEYEEVRLKACGDGREARAGVGYWMNLYTHRRPHPASNASTNRPKLWIRRFAWITQTPCPHSHSSDRRNSSNRLEGFFKEEPKGKRRRDSHLKSTGPWSQQDGPPHPNNRRDTV